jgi:hypothetical protein
MPTRAQQPMRRFRDPGTDQQGQQRRNEADREEAAPADERRQISAENRAQHRAERNEAGDEPADEAALCGWNELLHQGQVDAVEPADAEADEEAEHGEKDPAMLRRQRQDAGREREIEDGRQEHFAPADAVGDVAPDVGAGDRADARGEQDEAGLAISELPGLDDEGEDVADEVVVEELERIADGGGGNDLPLIGREPRLPVEMIEHRFLPPRSPPSARRIIYVII